MNTNNLEKNKRRLESFFEAINNKDFGFIEECLSNDLDWWIIGKTKTSGHKDKRTVTIGLKFIHRIYEGFRFQTYEMTAEDDRVSVRAESWGKHISGKNYNNQYHFLFKINQENKIFNAMEFLDTEHVAWIESS